MSLPQHPLSAAFPAMSAQDLSDLTDDIAAHGLRQPVVTYQGAVLDGWHRYSACIHAEVKPALVEYEGDDPVAFVLSLNMHRRNLTASQRAAAVVACSEWKPAGTNQFSGGSAPGAEALAEQAGVSVRTIHQAKAADDAGLGPAVRDGEVSAKRAAEVAKLPKAKQAAALKRKADPIPEAEQEPDALPDDATRMADIAADYEAALRVIEADDKLAAAWGEVKAMRAKHDQMEKLYLGKCEELRTMTREAKRWQRKADGK